MSSPNLSQEQAVSLLDKLCTDDAFRSAFTSEPGKALESIGIDCTNKTILCCSGIKTLAPKEELQAALKQLIEYVKGINHFEKAGAFEAGGVETFLRSI